MPSYTLDLEVGNFGTHADDLLRSVSGPTEADKPVIIELAAAAMEELIRMAHDGEPLWMPSTVNSDELLSEDEYLRTFPRGIGPRPLGLVSEASRETAVVIMNHVNLVQILMDVKKWAAVFCGIVSRAVTMEALSTGEAGSYNGAMHVMVAEFQAPSPLVPTREIYFVRYCKQHEDGSWAVVDVSLDSLYPGPISRSRRRPSGCLIQKLPNGYSKVTWVEHVEINDSGVHYIYKQLVNSNLAFGAKRWVATLARQCERLASAMACNVSAGDRGVISTPGERRTMLKLTERMVMNFYNGVGASTANTWTTLSGTIDGDVHVMARKSVDDPGRPRGLVLSAVTSFWLPIPPKELFNFLCDENSRSEWDILSYCGLVQELAHIANGQDPGNGVSLLLINRPNGGESNMLIVQESCSDPTGAYVIYAPVDIASMDSVLYGGDPDCAAILPSGFAILPDGPVAVNEGGQILNVGSGGSLLTVAFQFLADSSPTAKVSPETVANANGIIKLAVERIKAAVSCNNNA